MRKGTCLAVNTATAPGAQESVSWHNQMQEPYMQVSLAVQAHGRPISAYLCTTLCKIYAKIVIFCNHNYSNLCSFCGNFRSFNNIMPTYRAYLSLIPWQTPAEVQSNPADFDAYQLLTYVQCYDSNLSIMSTFSVQITLLIALIDLFPQLSTVTFQVFLNYRYLNKFSSSYHCASLKARTLQGASTLTVHVPLTCIAVIYIH